MRSFMNAVLILFLLFFITDCKKKQPIDSFQSNNKEIKANMVFFYYADINPIKVFYEKILGLDTVLDYGFAKAYRISETSFICLVDEKEGMHNSSEPKTVTLSFITNEVDAWYDYLISQGVKIHSPLGDATRHPTRGFVALDPAGYFLEFETFLDHPQNQILLEDLKTIPTLYPKPEENHSRPQELGILGSIIWLYYKNIPEAQQFYTDNLQLRQLVDQGFAKVYSSSPSAFIGLVDGAHGLHEYTEEKSVTISFFTDQIEDWYNHLISKGLKMRAPLEYAEEERVLAFVTYDSAGYYLEFDKFQEHNDNQALLKIIDE